MDIQHNVSLDDKNWFRTGGPAKFYCEPTTPSDVQEALLYARSMDVALLGRGANILISDDGFDGLVIRPQLCTIEHLGNGLVKTGAGVDIQELIDWCLARNLINLEEFSGIPGTIGGSLYINVHYFTSYISDFLHSAQVMHTSGELITVDKDWFCFGYDTSTLQSKEYVLVSATFHLQKSSEMQAAYAKGKRDEMIRQRNSRYPTERTCGSFFRNFMPDELTHVKKLPFVAYYVDKLGIKGELRYGKAIVSHKHANMLVSEPGATSHDIVMLARTIQERVFDAFGIIPQPECQFIGFKTYPLYQDIVQIASRSTDLGIREQRLP